MIIVYIRDTIKGRFILNSISPLFFLSLLSIKNLYLISHAEVVAPPLLEKYAIKIVTNIPVKKENSKKLVLKMLHSAKLQMIRIKNVEITEISFFKYKPSNILFVIILYLYKSIL